MSPTNKHRRIHNVIINRLSSSSTNSTDSFRPTQDIAARNTLLGQRNKENAASFSSIAKRMNRRIYDAVKTL